MNKSKTKEILLIAGAGLFLCAIILVNLLHFCYRMNADIASDVILAKMIWDKKQIVPDTWYLANEARIICTPNVAALLYGMTGNMNLSTGLACCVMTMLIIVSSFFACSALGWKTEKKLMFILLILVLPSNLVILELLYLFAGYYATHIIILFFTLGIYLQLLENKRVKPFVLFLTISFSMILGIQGMRGILVLYAPLLGIELIRNCYTLYRKEQIERKNICILGFSVVLLVCSFIGTLFPISVGQELSRNIRKGFQKLLEIVIPDMVKAIGFNSTNVVGKVCLSLFMLIVGITLIEIIIRMIKRKQIETEEWGFLVICSSPIVSAIMVSFTTIDSSERYYFMMIFAMAYAIVMNCNKWKKTKKWLLVLVAVITVVNIMLVYRPMIKSEEPPQTDSYKVSQYLINNHCLTAYATFENANTITVLSNGKVRVAPVASLEKMDICKWMSSTDWYVPNVPFESRTTYIVTEREQDEFSVILKEHNADMHFETQIGKFLIYSSEYNYSNLGNM